MGIEKMLNKLNQTMFTQRFQNFQVKTSNLDWDHMGDAGFSCESASSEKNKVYIFLNPFQRFML